MSTRIDEASANARLAAIVDSSDDAIIGKTLEGRVTDWNRAAQRLFGYTAEEAVGRHISLIAPPGREGEMAEIIARIRRGERVAHFETVRRRKDGSTVEISLTVSPVRDANGRIVGASKIARDITERRRNDERMQLLLRELDHRAKNVLAVVQAMLRLTRADTIDDYMKAIEGRIRALASVHGQMADNSWDGAEISALAAAEMEVFAEDSERMTATGEPVWVSPAAAQVTAIVLHELATNATKYGALSKAQGTVELAWTRDADGNLRVSWRERGGPRVETPTRRGFGSQVIERSVTDQLGGKTEIAWKPDGLSCSFVIPAHHIVQRDARRASTSR